MHAPDVDRRVDRDDDLARVGDVEHASGDLLLEPALVDDPHLVLLHVRVVRVEPDEAEVALLELVVPDDVPGHIGLLRGCGAGQAERGPREADRVGHFQEFRAVLRERHRVDGRFVLVDLDAREFEVAGRFREKARDLDVFRVEHRELAALRVDEPF